MLALTLWLVRACSIGKYWDESMPALLDHLECTIEPARPPTCCAACLQPTHQPLRVLVYVRV